MMINADDKKWLTERFNSAVHFDEPLSRHTTLKVGGPVEVYIVPDQKSDLIELVKWSRERHVPCRIIGAGSNLLVTDGGIDGILINLRRCLDRIDICRQTEESTIVSAQAGVRLAALCAFALERGLAGMNFAMGIPGSIGGGIRMNAGTSSGWMGDVIDRITILSEQGNLETVDREEIAFSYRDFAWRPPHDSQRQGQAIIVEGFFRLTRGDSVGLRREAEALLQSRRNRQPVGIASAGSFFKNPPTGPTAGELIDQAGLKGKTVGGAAVSTRHANFILNSGHATATDILTLMREIQQTVKDRFNVNLKPEVTIVGT